MAHVLIIDDDELYCNMLSKMVQRLGHEAECAYTLTEGVQAAGQSNFDVVFMDVNLPDGNGLDYIPRIHEMYSSPEVIIITGLGDPDGAEMAVKSGAWDYIQKGAPLKSITLPLVRALQYQQEKNAAKSARVFRREGIIGSSPAIKACLDLMAQGAVSGVNILITGETGTGKELFARAIHENSPRAGASFITVDCAALPDTLVESVLFGHAKGAFTGADQSQEGLVTQAHMGTLFLDEVGELPLNVQKSFLRVLQEHRFRPVGGQKEIKSDFRLVAATNKNLEEMVRMGSFRSDLLFRLHTFTLELPPLRERLQDIKDLAMHYMTHFCERNGIGTKGVSPEFVEALTSYDWPGNVRELINTIDRSVVAAQYEPTLYRKHLPSHIRVYLARSSVIPSEAQPLANIECEPDTEILPSIQDHRRATEYQYLTRLMEATSGDIKKACRISGMSKSRLYDLLKKHGIHRQP